jgi:hypothetical protein
VPQRFRHDRSVRSAPGCKPESDLAVLERSDEGDRKGARNPGGWLLSGVSASGTVSWAFGGSTHRNQHTSKREASL